MKKSKKHANHGNHGNDHALKDEAEKITGKGVLPAISLGDLKLQVQEKARAKKISMSQAVREALSNWVNNEP